MSNDIDRLRLVRFRSPWSWWRPRVAAPAAACVAAVAVLVAQVPGPAAIIETMRDPAPASGPWVDRAAMALAGAAVWLLVGWAVLVALAAAGIRTGGRVGRLGSVVLRRLAPGTLRRAVITAMGVSVITGVAAPAAVAATAPAGSQPAATATGAAGSSACRALDLLLAVSGTAERGVRSPAPSRATASRAAITAPLTAIGPSAATTSPPDLDWPVFPPAGSTGDGDATGQRATVDEERPAPQDNAAPQEEAAPEEAAPPETSAGSGGGAATTEGPDTDAAEVVVRRGDTLWSIAADRLGPRASAADIDRSWRAWYAANRRVIGDDPDLILPGQRLQPPPTEP